MLSAGSSSCLPPVSVSVYGTGPGFLLLLFSCRSSGQETVNTHSAAPTHKSEQRAALYIQISNVERGNETKKKQGGKEKKSEERQGWSGRHMVQEARPSGRSKCQPLCPPPCLCINHYKMHFITFGATKLNPRFLWLYNVPFSPLALCWSISSPPPHFISSTSEAFKGTVPLLLLLSSKVLE